VCWRKLAPHWRLFFLVMVFTGLRVSEVLALRWKHINLFARTIEVAVRRYKLAGVDAEDLRNEDGPKSAYGERVVGFTKSLARELLAKRKASEFSDEEDYFYCRRAGLPHSYSGPYIALKKACRKAGVPWAATHTWRHTNASFLYNELGWTDKQVQVHHGHHSSRFTAETYIHLKPEQLPPTDKLDELIDVRPADRR
jgi:integrase